MPGTHKVSWTPETRAKAAVQVHGAQTIPCRFDPSRNMLKYIVIKSTKIKDNEKILSAPRQKQQITDNKSPERLSADKSAEVLQAGKEWHNGSKVMQLKSLQARVPYPARPAVRFDGGTGRLTDQHELREFSGAKPELQQILEERLYSGEKKSTIRNRIVNGKAHQ